MKLLAIAFFLSWQASFASAQSTAPPENPYSEVTSASGPIKESAAPAKPAPRAPDGKPDLSGFWKGPLIIGGMFKAVGGPPFRSQDGE